VPLLKRSCSIFVFDQTVSLDSIYAVSVSKLTKILAEGSFFSFFPKVYSYDIWTDDVTHDVVLGLVSFLHSEGVEIRFWNDLSLSEDFVFQFKPYVKYWGFYCPTFNTSDYQMIIGSHGFQEAQDKLDRFLSENINVFLHMPLYSYHLDDLPEWIDFILKHDYLTFFHYQKFDLSSSQRRSIHYFEQFLPVVVLPLSKPYLDSDLSLPFHGGGNFEWLFKLAMIRKRLRRFRSFFSI
tara:strand:- start:1696 stop:2406 length:711 start_codon:yes stop_codon:yes gene_type:complete